MFISISTEFIRLKNKGLKMYYRFAFLNLTMKKIFIIPATIFLVVLLTECHRTKSNFSVKGKFKIPVETTIYLGRLGISAVEPIDSFKIDADGKFSLRGYDKFPALYVLSFERNSIYIVVKPGDKLQVDIDNAINPFSYYVEGSAESRLVRDLIFEQEKVLQGINKISNEYEKSKENSDTFLVKKSVFDNQYDMLLSKHKEYTTKFIHENPKSLACIFALYQNFGIKSQPLFDKFEDIGLFNFVDSNLSALYPETPAVIALNRDVTEIKEQIKQKKYSENLFRPGRRAPDFEAVSIDTVSLSFSESRGKAFIFVFFASWNKPSSQEAIEVNKLYLNYKSKGIEVVGVSFDKSEQMLRAFIDTNKIEYPIVCDYAYWDSKYVSMFGVRAIPEIILLDKNHIVIQREIKSPELILTLEEWRKNKLL
jgi:peroxiredoxin